MPFIYGGLSVVSLLLIGLSVKVNKDRNLWLRFLFLSVFVCELGYFLISIADSLSFALMANRVAYLGNVFLPCMILAMILQICDISLPKGFYIALITVGVLIFLVAASQGILPLYYKQVSFEEVNGVGRLIREYGPLHSVYYLYLLAYLLAMIVTVSWVFLRGCIRNPLHAAFLIVAVLGNMIIWLIEQFIPRDFEFLSVSYILTEVLILLLHCMLHSYPPVAAYAPSAQPVEDSNEVFTSEQIQRILVSDTVAAKLTQREIEVLGCMLANKKRKEIAETLFVTESTIKKYTSQIYKKLEVSDRIELFLKLRKYR